MSKHAESSRSANDAPGGWPGRVCERLLRGSARDVTDEIAQGRSLVLAPHPDDETLGCGATIARKRAAGTPVRVVFATHGASEGEPPPLRMGEARAACKRLGVADSEVRFLDFPDGALDTHIDALAKGIAAELADYAPEQLFLPALGDTHPDHRALGQAALRASSALGAAQLLEYPVWFWHPRWWRGWLRTSSRAARHCLSNGLPLSSLRPWRVRAGPHRATKRAALEAHASQMGAGPEGAAARQLGDVEGGAFLRRLLGDDELFFPRPAGFGAEGFGPHPPRPS